MLQNSVPNSLERRWAQGLERASVAVVLLAVRPHVERRRVLDQRVERRVSVIDRAAIVAVERVASARWRSIEAQSIEERAVPLEGVFAALELTHGARGGGSP